VRLSGPLGGNPLAPRVHPPYTNERGEVFCWCKGVRNTHAPYTTALGRVGTSNLTLQWQQIPVSHPTERALATEACDHQLPSQAKPVAMGLPSPSHPTHPQWFEHQSVDTNLLTPSLSSRCVFPAWGGSNRVHKSSPIIPTAAPSTHAYMHACTRARTTSTKRHGNCNGFLAFVRHSAPPGILGSTVPRFIPATCPPLVKPSLNHNSLPR
jgi:hypothetical protein